MLSNAGTESRMLFNNFCTWLRNRSKAKTHLTNSHVCRSIHASVEFAFPWYKGTNRNDQGDTPSCALFYCSSFAFVLCLSCSEMMTEKGHSRCFRHPFVPWFRHLWTPRRLLTTRKCITVTQFIHFLQPNLGSIILNANKFDFGVSPWFHGRISLQPRPTNDSRTENQQN